MAATTAYASFSGLLKENVTSKIARVIPLTDKIARRWGIVEKKGIGKQYTIPVIVSEAGGMTFGGEDSSDYAINTPISPEVTQAAIKIQSFVMEGRISQDLIDRMTGGDKSWEAETMAMVKSLTDQASFAREIALMHGTAGIGNILARTNDSNTVQTFSISAQTWVPAIWQRLKGQKVDVYNGASKTTATTSPVVTSYSLANHTITLTGTEADLDNVAAGYTLYPEGAYGKMMQGLSYIVGSTALTIHGIAQGTYEVWQSNTNSAANSKVSLDLLYDSVVKLQNRGCQGDLTLIADPITAKDIKGQAMAKARKDPTAIRLDNKTTILGYDNQDITLLPYIYCKPGEALLVADDVIDRIGVDVHFTDLGGGTNNYVMPSAGVNGCFYRVGWNQALICSNPAFTLKINNIGSATA